MTDMKKEETLKKNQKNWITVSELISAEIRSHEQSKTDQAIDLPGPIGLAIDDKELPKDDAAEPKLSPFMPSSFRQQQQYMFLGIGVALLVGILILTSVTLQLENHRLNQALCNSVISL